MFKRNWNLLFFWARVAGTLLIFGAGVFELADSVNLYGGRFRGVDTSGMGIGAAMIAAAYWIFPGKRPPQNQ